ncbi:unnamed protein product [Acanthoscelides obtectus]|uniref:Uncharacterized protein n=1 Tax=Acanthoscelides obtectus TaxID=200917 RepID=A0A9P0M9T4_ACAOB|nr:unnamed protein product [Acanthoscelides obtectus]CAK1670386.1 hypothetical protein AOBTE_LOCUS27599 [Acanthoscelides obtectus]
MIKSAVLLLAAVAVSSAVPIDVYRGAYGVDKWPYYSRSYSGDYLRTILGGYGSDYGYGYGYGHPFYKRYGYGYGKIGGKWDDTYDIYSTIGDEYRRGVYDEVVPEVWRKFGASGDIYSTLKKHQIGDLLDLNDKHTLQQVHLMQGQHLLRDLKTEQLAQVLEDKEVLDRLDLVQQMEIQKQKERLEMLQWLQKLQLDQVHTIDDAKMTAYGYPAAYWFRTMKGIHGYGPYSTGYKYGSYYPYSAGIDSVYPYYGIRGGVY